jgi:hypothetical protein
MDRIGWKKIKHQNFSLTNMEAGFKIELYHGGVWYITNLQGASMTGVCPGQAYQNAMERRRKMISISKRAIEELKGTLQNGQKSMFRVFVSGMG